MILFLGGGGGGGGGGVDSLLLGVSCPGLMMYEETRSVNHGAARLPPHLSTHHTIPQAYCLRITIHTANCVCVCVCVCLDVCVCV